MFITRNGFSPGVFAVLCLLWMWFSTAAFAWEQEYIVIDPQNNTPERYTWDNDHPPRYDDILAERINASLTEPGFSFTHSTELPVDATHSLSVGWNIPVSANLSTGPVARWHYDGTNPSHRSDLEGLNTAALTDPLWHASVSTLGWRIDSKPFWGVHPWAQISLNQQFGENQWKMQSGLNSTTASTQDESWKDVTVGADMILNQHVAAWASLSQADNTAPGDNYLYMLGMSARF